MLTKFPACTAIACAVVCSATSAAASTPFAEPPDDGHREPIIAEDPVEPSYDHHHGHHGYSDFYHPKSTVRLGVGPALRLEESSAKGGLFTHLDVGTEATGLRLSASWVGVGSRNGLSQYGGELWLDFAHDSRLHPVLGAGAGFALLTLEDDVGELKTHGVGVGTLRAGLHYLLPINDATDARAALEVIGSLPAIKPSSAPTIRPWAMAVAAVQVGF